MSAEVSALRVEVAELKDLLVQVLDAVGKPPTIAGLATPDGWPPPTPTEWDDANIPQEIMSAALARGDRTLLHSQNKARAKALKKKKGIYK